MRNDVTLRVTISKSFIEIFFFRVTNLILQSIKFYWAENYPKQKKRKVLLRVTNSRLKKKVLLWITNSKLKNKKIHFWLISFLVYLIYFENRFYLLLTKFGKSWIFLGWLQMSYLLIFETGHFDCIASFLWFHLLLVYFISATLVRFSLFYSGRAGSVYIFYFYV